jgi:Domain of unknown function (DUF4145)
MQDYFQRRNDLLVTSERDQRAYWSYRSAHCPGCEEFTIEIAKVADKTPTSPWRQIYPIGANRGPVPTDVPIEIAQDYVEACNVLPLSAKASAALSRRCLQNMLHAHGYKARDLAKEIDLLLSEEDPRRALPHKLRETVDAIRNFGNFSAHPIDDKTTLQVIDVEPHEAEWCLETIEELFEYFYVGPAAAKAKKAALNAKLAAGGKRLPNSTSPLLIRVSPLVRRDLARLGQLNHVHRRRVAIFPAGPTFQRGLELPQRRIPRTTDGIERQPYERPAPGNAARCRNLRHRAPEKRSR